MVLVFEPGTFVEIIIGLNVMDKSALGLPESTELREDIREIDSGIKDLGAIIIIVVLLLIIALQVLWI